MTLVVAPPPPPIPLLRLFVAVKIKCEPANKHRGATSDHDGVACSRRGSVGAIVGNRWQEKSLMCAWPITYDAREKFFKVVAVRALVQGKSREEHVNVTECV